MSRAPWMRWNAAEFLADPRVDDLTPHQELLYRRLLEKCHLGNGRLTRKDSLLRRFHHPDALDTFDADWAVVSRFFVAHPRDPKYLTNLRVLKDLDDVHRKRTSGSRGGRARAERAPRGENGRFLARPANRPTPSDVNPDVDASSSSGPGGCLAGDARQDLGTRASGSVLSLSSSSESSSAADHLAAAASKTGRWPAGANAREDAGASAPAAAAAAAALSRDYLEEWNAWAGDRGVRRVLKLTAHRLEHLRAREADQLAATWPMVLRELSRASEWIRGFRGFSFDWLIKDPNNWVKVLEGTYADRPEEGSAWSMLTDEQKRILLADE